MKNYMEIGHLELVTFALPDINYVVTSFGQYRVSKSVLHIC